MDISGKEYVSLCIVWCNERNGSLWLSRLADFENGRLTLPNIIESEPKYFGNRERLYWQDGPEKPGTMGIWRWTATPQYKDTEKDKINCSFDPRLRPTRFVLVKKADSLQSLKEELLQGVPAKQYDCDTFFGYEYQEGKYQGFRCKLEQLDMDQNIRLKEDVFFLPVYSFTDKDVLTFKHNMRVLRPVQLPEDEEMVQVRDRDPLLSPTRPVQTASRVEESRTEEPLTDEGGTVVGENKRLTASEAFAGKQYAAALERYRDCLEQGNVDQAVITKTLKCLKELARWDDYRRFLEYTVFQLKPERAKRNAYCLRLYLLYYENGDDQKIEELFHRIPNARRRCRLSTETVSALLAMDRVESAEAALSALRSMEMIPEKEYDELYTGILGRKACSENEFSKATGIILRRIEQPELWVYQCTAYSLGALAHGRTQI